jgi:hypothetical protein
MVGPHSSPLHGLRTSRYRGGRAVCLLSGRLGISPNISPPVVKLLCHASPVLSRFRVNGSHASHHRRSLSLSHNDTLLYSLTTFSLVVRLAETKDGLEAISRYHGRKKMLTPQETFRKRCNKTNFNEQANDCFERSKHHSWIT